MSDQQQIRGLPEPKQRKTHVSVVAYSDGNIDRIGHYTAESAERYVARFQNLVGKKVLTSGKTGEKVAIVSCEVLAIA